MCAIAEPFDWNSSAILAVAKTPLVKNYASERWIYAGNGGLGNSLLPVWYAGSLARARADLALASDFVSDYVRG